MIPTIGPRGTRGESGDDRGAGGVFAILTIGLVVTQAALYGWIVFVRSRRQAGADAGGPRMICFCPFCRRKFAYTARRAGTSLQCARCKTTFFLPLHGIIEEK
jgi:hypothetical protein